MERELIDQDAINKLIEVQLKQTVDQAVEKLVEETIENLLFNEAWLEKIQNQIGRNISDRISKTIREVGIRDVLRDVVIENADIINPDINRELTVEEGLIVVDNHISAETLDTRSDVNIGGALVIDGELAVKGRISLSNPSFKELSTNIKEDAIAQLKTGFIEETTKTIQDNIQDGLNIKNILIRGKSLVDGDTLSSAVTKTNIQELGTLKNLSVGTELSVANKRIGINTSTPTSALTVWDNEITIDIGKRSENVAQLGTSKAHDLSIITNNKEQIRIDKDGLVSIDKLRIGRNRISTSNATPGWSGAKGDIVFNYNYKKGQPFAWICLGDYRWQELMSA